MEKIIGLIDAPFTPFHADGEVNLEPIERYAQMLQHNGLKGARSGFFHARHLAPQAAANIKRQFAKS